MINTKLCYHIRRTSSNKFKASSKSLIIILSLNVDRKTFLFSSAALPKVAHPLAYNDAMFKRDITLILLLIYS